MTENRRIFFNVVATYGRSLYAMVCGLFTARWVLMALGTEDFGLYGVVGGLASFVMFISYILQGATSRFYAFNIGKAQKANALDEGVEECRKWFNTSLAIHAVVPAILVTLLYFVGDWGVVNFLKIPDARVLACRWVLVLTCVSCYANMVNVPMIGMFVAKQYIAELTIYNFFTTTFNVLFVYYMVSHRGDWLTRYAIWTCILSVVPQIIIGVRAIIIFPECRLNFRYWGNVQRIKEMANYAGWNLLEGLATSAQGQGNAILVNKYFGPVLNASFAVATSVNVHCCTLVSAMRSAFIPALTTACGSGDLVKMRRMAMQSCKFASVLSLIFMVPLSLELTKIVELWLKVPPPNVVGLCWCMMVASLLENIGMGHSIAINALGRVAKFQLISGVIKLLVVPLAWMLLVAGMNVYAVGISFVGVMVAFSLSRAWLARSLASLSIVVWIKSVILPVVGLSTIAIGVGIGIQFVMPPSLARVFVTGGISELLILSLAWFLVLDDVERDFLATRFPMLNRWRCRI